MRAAALALALAGVPACVSSGAAPPATVLEIAPPVPARAVAPSPEPEASVKQVAAAEPDGSRFEGALASMTTRGVQGDGYRYRIPAEWEEIDATTLGSALISHAQRALQPTGNFTQNVNIASEPYVGDGPSYGASNLVEVAKISTIRDQRPARVGPRDGWDIEAWWPNVGGEPYVTMQRYGTNGERGYVITCSMGARVVEDLRPLCTAILDTFRVE